MDNDIDTMMDVYMTTEQRAAYYRLCSDATRYRWMRGMKNREIAASCLTDKMNADAAIDAAMVSANTRN